MPSSPSLSEKIARSPLRFGLIFGFLGVPLLWMAGDSLVRVAQGQAPLPAEAFWGYEASGALVGALLGGNIARIWAHWRAKRLAEARATALLCGGVGVAFYAATAGLQAGMAPDFWAEWLRQMVMLVVSRHLPFLLCALLLFGGLLAPRR